MVDAPPPDSGGDASPRRAVGAPERGWRERVKKVYGLVSDILSPTRLLVLLGVLVLVPLGLFGGFDAMAQEELPTVKADTLVDLAPFTLMVTAARYGDELTPVAYPEDGVRYLFLAVEVTNTTDEPVSAGVLAQAVGVDIAGLMTTEGATTATPTVYRTEDALSARVYSPGVVVPTVVTWHLDATEPLPEEVTVTFHTQTWRASVLDGSWGWRDPEAARTMTLPLQPLKDA